MTAVDNKALTKMKEFVDRKHHNKHTMDDWQGFFRKIFEDRDSIQAPFMWLKVAEKASNFSEAIRKEQFDDAARAIARMFLWICEFCSKNQDVIGTSKLSEVVWHKYPYVCPHCSPVLMWVHESIKDTKDKKRLLQLGCYCQLGIETTSNKGVNDKSLDYFRNLADKPNFLDDWVRMFRKIYGSRINIMTLESIAFHLFEEVGEVISSLRFYAELSGLGTVTGLTVDDIKTIVLHLYNDPDRLGVIFKKHKKAEPLLVELRQFAGLCVKEEIADVFSWLAASVIKFTSMRVGYIDHDKRYTSSSIGPADDPDLREAFGKLLSKMVPTEHPLSSIVALEYTEGCTICHNFTANEESVTCICDSGTPSGVIGRF